MGRRPDPEPERRGDQAVSALTHGWSATGRATACWDMADRLVVIDPHLMTRGQRCGAPQVRAAYEQAQPVNPAGAMELLAGVLGTARVAVRNNAAYRDFARVLAAVDEVTGRGSRLFERRNQGRYLELRSLAGLGVIGFRWRSPPEPAAAS